MAIRCVVCIDWNKNEGPSPIINEEDYEIVNKPSPKPTRESKHAPALLKSCKETTEPHNLT